MALHLDIVTPENIEFTYRLAGPFRRLGAYLLDSLFCRIFVIVAMLAVMLVFSVIILNLVLGIFFKIRIF